MSRRSNAVRALDSARRAELAARDALLATPTRDPYHVATAPVVGDSFTGGNGLVWRVAHVRPASSRDSGYVWGTLSDADPLGTLYTSDQWARVVRAASHVSPVEHPARIARRLVWERAAARRETARATLDALPPAGHKRRKDGTCYPVQSPRQNAAAKAGRLAWQRAVGRSIAFMGVALAFVVLFLSACN